MTNPQVDSAKGRTFRPDPHHILWWPETNATPPGWYRSLHSSPSPTPPGSVPPPAREQTPMRYQTNLRRGVRLGALVRLCMNPMNHRPRARVPTGNRFRSQDLEATASVEIDILLMERLEVQGQAVRS